MSKGYCCLLASKQTAVSLWHMPVAVCTVFNVHHQELKTIHTATGICQTDTVVCLLTSRQQYLFDICLLQYVQSLTPDDGRKGRPKHVECYSNETNLRHWCVWLVYYGKILPCTALWTSKCVFWFYVQLLSETILIWRRIQRDTTINVHMSSCKVFVTLIRF